ncbi:PEP-CTERM protein-sorting domain-containing protein [Nitrosospira multiformis]|uniref:PEP-CTERM protein-sorting domain-containing protein n=1 Tax=Nitrosospira multiformis TaxID=1231 RepID=A0A1H8IL64_9PROT|nr:PEP-CTERM sorting domain-containing protein [Nitrosospira multiformis]SEN69079.1 PEP-CTERM protein-sorting domain-containing protein [Nitrosospira multiformis]
MPKKKAMFYVATGVFLATTTLTSSISVAALISASVGGIPISDAVYENFNNLSSSGGLSSKGIYVTFNGIDSGTAALPDVSGKYAAPYVISASDHLFNDIPQEDGPDRSQYLATGIGSVTLDLNAYHQYFGLLWGSVDSYNILSFYDGSTLLFNFTGLDVTRLPNGDQGVNGTFYVNITSDVKFNKVIASSSQYSFEFDNVALVDVGTSSQEIQEIPEPGTLALLGLGLLAGSITRYKE